MGEALGGLKRTMYCGLVREANIGERITLMGWVQRNRKQDKRRKNLRTEQSD